MARGVAFELERFGWVPASGALEVAGRWRGGRRRVLGVPELVLVGSGTPIRLGPVGPQVDAEAARDPGLWRAEYLVPAELPGVLAAQLEIGTALVVELPAPDGGRPAAPVGGPGGPLGELQAQVGALTRQLEAERGECARLRESLARSAEEAARIADDLRAEIAGVAALAADRERELVAARVDLTAARRAVEADRAELRAAAAELEGLRAEHGRLVPEVERARTALAAAGRRAEADRAEAHGAQQEIARLRTEVLELHDELEALRLRAEDAPVPASQDGGADRADAEARLEVDLAMLREVEAQREAALAERDAAESRRAAAEAARAAAQAQVTALRRQLAGVRGEPAAGAGLHDSSRRTGERPTAAGHGSTSPAVDGPSSPPPGPTDAVRSAPAQEAAVSAPTVPFTATDLLEDGLDSTAVTVASGRFRRPAEPRTAAAADSDDAADAEDAADADAEAILDADPTWAQPGWPADDPAPGKAAWGPGSDPAPLPSSTDDRGSDGRARVLPAQGATASRAVRIAAGVLLALLGIALLSILLLLF